MIPVIGGSQNSGEKRTKADGLNVPALGLRGWGPALVLFIAILLFGGAVVNWFSPMLFGSSLVSRFIQLAVGSAAMGCGVALLGNLLVNRHAVRWGVIVPLITMVAGSLLAVIAQRSGGWALLLSTPFMAGFSVAAGLVTSYFVSDVSATPALKAAA